MATATPYVSTAASLVAADLVAVATTGATTTSPYGFTTKAQADAIVTGVNAIIALLKANVTVGPS